MILNRKHLELTANYDSEYVLVKSFSTYPCFIDDYELKKGDNAKLLPGMTLHIIGKEYPHYVCFKIDKGFMVFEIIVNLLCRIRSIFRYLYQIKFCNILILIF